jgi:transcription antitermination factor NusG
VYQPGVAAGSEPVRGEDGTISRAEGPASGPEWFAVYTRNRHEKLVNRGLEALGFETYLPLVRRLRRWSDRNKPVELPLFPGYVFVRCTETERSRAFGARGIVRFVTAEGRAVPVPPAEIDAIREVLRSDVPFEPHPKLTSGQPVRVTAGPFRGYTGKLVRRGRRFRLLLAVSAIGQGISIEVDAADVEPE